jgi:hypothetical protein
MNSPLKYQVRLTDDQRRHLEHLARDGHTPARPARLARLLLHADQAHPEGCRTDEWIAAALGMHVNTVAAARKRFVAEGPDAALSRRVRTTPPVPPKIDGRVEAHLVALCGSPPPRGRDRWTMQLLADELRGRGLVATISAEAVRRALKKMRCSPGASSGGASPSGTRPGSSPTWSRSSTSTPPRRAPTSR